MTRMPSKPGSTPVGLLKNLSQGAAASVAYRLLWPNVPESQVVKSQAKVWNDVAVGLGLRRTATRYTVSISAAPYVRCPVIGP